MVGQGSRRRIPSSSRDRVFHAGQRTIYTAGRPPWYNEQGQLQEAFVIGICGGSGSGKTTVAERVVAALDVPWVSILSMDSFYKVLSAEDHERAARNEYNFDHPDAFDVDLLVQRLSRLKAGKQVEVPIYNFTTHSREEHTKQVYGANVVVFEGILTFCDPRILQLLDLKIFVDTDADIRLLRRLRRDIAERERQLDGVLKQYFAFVKPAYDHYIEPTMKYADVIVPRGGMNQVAIDLITQTVHKQLNQRGCKLRNRLLEIGELARTQPLPRSVFVLPPQKQVLHLLTQLRDRQTARDEFIFYSKRLMRLLFEYGLSLLPYESHALHLGDATSRPSHEGSPSSVGDCNATSISPSSSLIDLDEPPATVYRGCRCATQRVCGVSIMRAGEAMESALAEVCKDVIIGKILIQTNEATDEPELHYLKLPKDMRAMRVFLMDATVASGAAAMMAIRVLLEHDVPEENITLVSLIMAVGGVQTLAYAFPKITIVTTAVDELINDQYHILPGMGNFGDRFFGTGFVDGDDDELAE